MRKIKFDAIYKPTGEHFEPWKIKFSDNTVWGDFDGEKQDWCSFSFDGTYGDAILRQYTGLKDRKGTEIYEGDIIRFCDFASDRTGGHMGDSIITGKVVYDYAMFFVNDEENGETGFSLCDAHLNDDELEVIGNIYEKPELLKGEVR